MRLLKNAWLEFLTFCGGILAVLLYYMLKKNKEVKEVTKNIDSLKTEKEADVLDAEINKLKKEAEDSKKLQTELEKAQTALDEKRHRLISDSKTPKSPQEIAKYWEDN